MAKDIFEYPMGIIGPNEGKLGLSYPVVNIAKSDEIISKNPIPGVTDNKDDPYLVIPDFPDYIVNSKCVIYKLSSHKRLAYSYDRRGYLRVNVNGYNRPTHRLMLSAFRPVLGMDKLLVNHINGIKDDNRLENLEWVTNGQNVQHGHAVRKNKYYNIPMGIMVRNVFTGQTWEFEHVIDCAKHFGLHKDTVLYRVDKPIGKICADGLQFMRRSEGLDWSDVKNQSLLEITGSGGSRAVIVKLLETNEIMEFSSTHEAATKLGIVDGNISVKLNTQTELKAYKANGLLYQIKLKHDDRPWKEYPTKYHALEEADNNFRYIVIVDKNGVETVFNTLQDVSNVTGIKRTTVAYRANLARTTHWSDGYIYMYYMDWYNHKYGKHEKINNQ